MEAQGVAQKRFGIDLNNGTAISGAGLIVLLVSFLVFFPMAVAALIMLATQRLDLETVATAVGLLIGPALVVFCLGLLGLKLIRVPFLRSSSDIIDAENLEGGSGSRKVWWVWRAFAGVMGLALIGGGVVGLADGNTNALLLLAIGVPALVYVAILGRDV